MPRLIRCIMLPVVILTLAACAGKQPAPEIIKNPDDPLIGQIYHFFGPEQLSEDELFRRMATSDVIYLGENHDNIHHHRIQLETVQALVALGKRPAIGFEFFSRPQTSRLIQFQDSPDKFHNTEDENHSAGALLRQQLGWNANRDDDWDHLFPILQYAREQKLPVFGADLNAGLRRQLSKKGYAGLTPVEKLLAPETDFSNDDYREHMFQSFTAAHCGWRDDGYLEKLYDTWLARNEAMAESIVATHRANPDEPVVVIMGGGHSEYNMGVYERVARRDDSLRQVNLRLRSVEDTPYPAGLYFNPLSVGGSDFGPPYEYLWFTARMPEKEDPCEAFLKYKNKHAKKTESSTTNE